MNRMLEDQILTELDKQANAGLSATNMDRVYKLLCMLGEIHEINYREAKTNEIMGYEPQVEFGSLDRYQETKKDYRNNHSGDMKRELINKLEVYLDGITKEIEDVYNDADCAEERSTIQRYVNRIKML